MTKLDEIAQCLLEVLEGYRLRGAVLESDTALRHSIDIQPSANNDEFCINFGLQLDRSAEPIRDGTGYDMQGRVSFDNGDMWFPIADFPVSEVRAALLRGPLKLIELCPDRENLAVQLSGAGVEDFFWPASVHRCVRGLGAFECASLLEEFGNVPSAILWAERALEKVPKVARGRRKKIVEMLDRLGRASAS